MKDTVKLLIWAGEISYIGNVHIDLDEPYGVRELGNRLRRPNCPAGKGEIFVVDSEKR